jgi:hypothetical protein
MSTIDFVASQAPFMGDYIHAAKAYWDNSRHPGNVSEIMSSARDQLPEGAAGLVDYPILVGTLALQAFEITPANENLLTRVGFEHFVETGNVIESAVRVGSVTGPLELTLGLGMAYGLHRFAPTVDLVKERYLNKPKEKDLEAVSDRTSVWKRALGKYGIALSTGASGSVIYTDIVEEERTFKDNAKTGAKAAALLAANNTIFAAGILYATKSDLPYLADFLEHSLDVVSNPLIVASVAGGYIAAKQTVQIHKVPKDSTSEETTDDIEYSFAGKITRRFRKNKNQQAIDDFLAS